MGWEPSVVQFTPVVYPRLVLNFDPIKVNPLNLEPLKTKLRTRNRFYSRVPQSKFEANRPRGVLSYNRTYKQTDNAEITSSYTVRTRKLWNRKTTLQQFLSLC